MIFYILDGKIVSALDGSKLDAMAAAKAVAEIRRRACNCGGATCWLAPVKADQINALRRELGWICA